MSTIIICFIVFLWWVVAGVFDDNNPNTGMGL